jgi:hypothetical protein
MWMSGPHLRSHPMSLPTRTRSDTRNSLLDQLGHPIGWSFVFLSSYFLLHRQAKSERERSQGLSGVPAMARLRPRGVRQRCRLRMVIRARDAVSAKARQRCHALLPARVIAGHRPSSGVVASAHDRAPWIGIRRLRVASLRFAQQRSGHNKKHDNGRQPGPRPQTMFVRLANARGPTPPLKRRGKLEPVLQESVLQYVQRAEPDEEQTCARPSWSRMPMSW